MFPNPVVAEQKQMVLATRQSGKSPAVVDRIGLWKFGRKEEVLSLGGVVVAPG